MIHLYVEMGQEPNSLDPRTSLNFYMIPTCIHHGMAFWLPRHFGVTRFLLNPSFRVPNLIENKVTILLFRYRDLHPQSQPKSHM